MNLPDDQARCTGQPIGGAWQCPERNGCERYRVFSEFCQSVKGLPIDDAARTHRWPLISVAIRYPSEDCPLHMGAGHG